MGILACFRGVHSAGAMGLSRKGFGSQKVEPFWYKTVDNAVGMLSEKDFRGSFNTVPIVLMGHARHATLGSHTLENAHPHVFSNLYGMHNGTIYSLYDSKLDRSDSSILFEKINKEGPEYLASLKSGAYAIQYLDITDNSIYIARNEQRTLFYMHGNGGLLAWASEIRMLAYIKTLHRSFADADIIPFETDRIYRFKGGSVDLNSRALKSITPVSVPSVPLLPASKPPPETKAIPRFETPKEYPYSEARLLPPVQEKETKKEEKKKVGAYYKHYRGAIVEISKADDLLSCGCVYCGSVEKAQKRVLWLEPNEYLCEICRHDPALRGNISGFSYISDIIKVN